MTVLPTSRLRPALLAMAIHLALAAAASPAALAQAGRDAEAPVRPGEPITLNFTNAEIEAVARTMAVITGRDVVVDPRVKGTMNLHTERPVPPLAAFDQFSAALRLQGFAIVQADGLYKVLPEADAKLQTGTVATSVAAAGSAGDNQIVTQVFRLNYESAASLLPVLRPLIPPNNTINVNPGNNSLVITDYAGNLRRLARIVASLDVPNASDIEVIPLRHAIASDMVPLVQRLVEGGSATATGAAPAAGGAADASFRTALLADPRSNAIVVRAANPARVQLIRTLVEKLDRPPIDSGNGEAGNIYVVYLKNADAVRLAATLRAAIAAGQISANGQPGAVGGAAGQAASAASNMASQLSALQSQNSLGASTAATAPVNNANQPSTGGQIQADPSTNSLIITAPAPQYRQIRAVIDRLDTRRAQVMIEALIVEVSANKAAQFGVQWQAALGNNGAIGNYSSLTGTNLLNLTLALAQTVSTGTLPSSGLSLPSGMSLGATGRIGNQTVLGAIANFFGSDGDANVLSTPNLMTLDNEEAKIVIGQNVPFVTGQYATTTGTSGISPFTTIERKDVGLTLRVRPQINENGTVKLTIFQETSAVVGTTASNVNGPTTNKRSVESSVLVEDGGLVMLGGLLSDTYRNDIDKVPLAGDIPVVGNLFRSESRSREKSNLMMFLRPVVMRDAASTEAFSYGRYQEIRGMQQQVQPDTSNLMLRNVVGAPVLPAIEPAGVPRSRMEGTQLIPPPQPAAARAAPAAGSSGDWDPMRGALPPTADPASRQPSP